MPIHNLSSLEQLSSQGSGISETPAVRLDPSSADTEAFRQKLNEEVTVGPHSVGNLEFYGQPKIQSDQSGPGKLSPGDNILLALQNASNVSGAQRQEIARRIEGISENDGISNIDLVRLQQLTVEYQLTTDLTSKAAGSLTQGLQTLFRNQ
jgi:hypothetical protein